MTHPSYAEPPLLSLSEAAELLNVTTQWLRQRVVSGEIAAVRLTPGNPKSDWRIPRGSLDPWLGPWRPVAVTAAAAPSGPRPGSGPEPLPHVGSRYVTEDTPSSPNVPQCGIRPDTEKALRDDFARRRELARNGDQADERHYASRFDYTPNLGERRLDERGLWEYRRLDTATFAAEWCLIAPADDAPAGAGEIVEREVVHDRAPSDGTTFGAGPAEPVDEAA